MKKLIVGLFAVALMSLGLVGFTSTSASAACKPSEYVACPKSKTNVKPAVTKTKKAVVRPKVTAPGVKPKGTVKVVCKKIKGKGIAKGAAPAGKAVKLNLKKKGAYKCTAKYIGTNAKNSSDKFVVIRK